jgi:hypothetical protein
MRLTAVVTESINGMRVLAPGGLGKLESCGRQTSVEYQDGGQQ